MSEMKQQPEAAAPDLDGAIDRLGASALEWKQRALTAEAALTRIAQAQRPARLGSNQPTSWELFASNIQHWARAAIAKAEGR